MAITSVDTYIAGLLSPYSFWKAAATGEAAGEYFTPFYTAGNPGAAVAPSPGLAGAALTSYAGQLPFPAAVAGDSVYLADWTVAQGGNVGGVMLCDRLWHNSGFTITTITGQTVNSVAWPARDYSLSTSGVDVMVGIEVSATTGNGGVVTTATLTYTDSDGNSGNTATMAAFPASAVTGTFVPFVLAAGDRGIRSVQTLTLGTSLVSGTIHLVAYRVIAQLGTPVANTPAGLPAAHPRRMADANSSATPWLLYQLTGTAVGAVAGTLLYSQA